MIPKSLCAPRLLPSALLTALFFAVPLGGGGWSAFAQESADAMPEADSGDFVDSVDSVDSDDSDEVAGVEEIVVTGTRIPHKANVLSSSPVTQVDSEEFLFRGITRVEDLLNRLPQVFTAQQSGQVNGSTGTATVNLRNLEALRTLVLVDGRRLPYGSPIAGATGADVNQIPGALVRQVEVLTGGASATYGSDAVAGVVNFYMVDDFEGMRFDYQYSFYEHENDHRLMSDLLRQRNFAVPDKNVRDGKTSDFSIIMGANLDEGRGNITAYATYRNVSSVLQSARDYSACALGDGTRRCAGSSTLPDGRFTDFGTATTAGGIISGDPVNPAFRGFDYIVGGDGTDFVNRAGLLYNYGPLNYYQRPNTRYTAGVLARYDVNERVEAYMNLMITDNRTDAQIAPSGAFFVTSTFNCNNPFLSAQQFQQICGRYGLDASYVYGATESNMIRDNREFLDADMTEPNPTFGQMVRDPRQLYIGRRNVEGEPRSDDLRHTTLRGVFGIRGDLDRVWSYDLYGQFAEVNMAQTYNNDLSTERISRALNVVPDPRPGPNQGEPVCQAVLDDVDPNCVPWNIFEAGGVTQAAITYLTRPLYARGTTEQSIISGYVQGDLGEYGFRFPGANDGIEVVLGFEYRREFLGFHPDSGFTSGDGAGQGGPRLGVVGRTSLREFFTEVSIPLIEGAPLIDALILDTAYRYSDYSTNVTTSTYRFAGSWNVTEDFKLRASFQRAARHPNIRELFRTQSIGLFDMAADPCAGPAPAGMDGVRRTASGRTLEECMRTGVTAAQFGTIAGSPANQYNQITGGNPDLKPEETDTLTLGFVLTPLWLSGFTFTVDYFDIDLQKAIDSVTSEFILTQCLDTGAANFCDSVNRGANTGTLWVGTDNIRSLDVNIGFFQTSGFDIVIDYETSLGALGELDISSVTTYLRNWSQQQIAGAPVDVCDGRWGGSCGSPTPDFVNNFRATWRTPWDVVVSFSWRHIGAVDDLGVNQVHFGEYNYMDLAAIWDVNEDLTLRVGFQNLLDVNPPITSDAGAGIFGNGNTFPGTYDALGRYIFAGANISF